LTSDLDIHNVIVFLGDLLLRNDRGDDVDEVGSRIEAHRFSDDEEIGASVDGFGVG